MDEQHELERRLFRDPVSAREPVEHCSILVGALWGDSGRAAEVERHEDVALDVLFFRVHRRAASATSVSFGNCTMSTPSPCSD